MKHRSRLIVATCLLALVSVGLRGQGGGGGGQSASTDPTPFELFVKKLKLDSKKQQPQVEKIFTAAATEAVPIVQDMIRLRTAMVTQDGNAEALAVIHTGYTADAARMAAIEVRAFKEVQALLSPGQLSKSAEAFTLMAGLFQPPSPQPARPMPRGRGGL